MKEHHGAEAVLVAGFCWGGKMIMKAAALGAEGGVKAAGCVHPAMLSPELAEDVSDLLLCSPCHRAAKIRKVNMFLCVVLLFVVVGQSAVECFSVKNATAEGRATRSEVGLLSFVL